MKLLKYIPVALMTMMAFASCDSDLDKVTYNEADAKAGTLNAIASSYVLEEDKAGDIVETYKWTEASFGYDAAITYRLEVDLAGKNFANKRTISSLIGKTEASVTYKELNNVILGLDSIYEIPVNTEADYDIRISATIGDVVTPVYTNVVTTKITTYEVIAKYPGNVYMIGAEFGGWNWGDAGVVEMTPINGQEGKFWAVRYFADPADGFKWCNVKDWNGDFFTLGTDAGFTTHDGNAVVAAAGFYIVVVDYTVNTITIEPAQVYGMGDCFGGWNTGEFPFAPDGNVMKLTASGAGELRIYANASVAGIGGDWWRMEFVILNGKIVYRGNGDDQERVPVAAGKVITLDFNAGTGTIE
jgi:hypothetical protein